MDEGMMAMKTQLQIPLGPYILIKDWCVPVTVVQIHMTPHLHLSAGHEVCWFKFLSSISFPSALKYSSLAS